MPHPQSSPRGLFAKSIQIPTSQGLLFGGYSGSTNLLQANSTGLRVAGQVRVQDARYVGANTTGYLFTTQAAKPTTRTAGYRWTFIQNSTGVCGIGINTTGTTWKFANVTSVLPT